jgi:hypothetical protein
MTPHKKMIEAMALSAYDRQWGTRSPGEGWDREPEWVKEKYRKGAAEDIAFGLASARASGWDMKPLDFPYEPLTNAQEYNKQQSRAVLIWRNMFGVAPRFEDAS